MEMPDKGYHARVSSWWVSSTALCLSWIVKIIGDRGEMTHGAGWFCWIIGKLKHQLKYASTQGTTFTLPITPEKYESKEEDTQELSQFVIFCKI